MLRKDELLEIVKRIELGNRRLRREESRIIDFIIIDFNALGIKG